MTGTVLTGRNNIFTVKTGERELRCRLKGKTLDLPEREYNPLAPGDEVAIDDIDSENSTGTIAARRQRRSRFGRFNRKRDAVQTIGANVDLVVCLMSVRQPVFRHRFVDRVGVLAAFYQLPLVILVTKADLDRSEAERWIKRYTGIGYDSISVSMQDSSSVRSVRERLKGRRSLLVGQSGVGKSSLINALAGKELRRINEVSRRHSRGRHTTTAARLLAIDTIEIIDTPGIRELDCRHIPIDELAPLFNDLAPHAEHCAITSCTHRSEPGCGVRDAVVSGSVQKDRYDSYLRLYREIASYEEVDA
jgi:ribosome biogenesis GTPase